MSSSSTLESTVDVDFWVKKPNMLDLAPYLDASWREWIRAEENGRPAKLPESQYFFSGEALAVADPPAAARERLEALGGGPAIFNPAAASNVSGYGNPVLSSEIARAVNGWTTSWLDQDDRLRGSIVVSPRDPAQAAEEIRRAGADRRMVAVLLSYPQQLLGDRRLYPVYEAACELGLPVMLEAGGAYSGSNRGLTVIGDPTSAFEALVTWEFAGQPHLLSALTSGIFDRHRDLRIVLSGFGVAWLPSLLWRLDHEYRRRRVKPPAALTRLPSEYVPDHVRFTTSALELPADPAELVRLLEPVGGDRLLLYGSGPLAGDEARTFLQAAGPEWALRAARENARELYRLDAPALAG
jgi:predicted TIM-barrel fold metal-dependent hydrolase